MDSFRIDDARDRDDLVAPHNEGPRLALRAGDLRVDENVLDLLAPPGEAIACAPGSYLKAWQAGFDAPLAPTDLAFERDRSALEPHAVVLAHGRQPGAEVEPLRAGGRGEQLVERGR